MEGNMAKESNYSQLEPNMWAISSQGNAMGKELTPGQINRTIRESLEMGKFMEKVRIIY